MQISFKQTLDLIHELEDVIDKVLIFNNLLKHTLHTPFVTVKIKNRPCPLFVTDEIKVMMRNRDHLHRIFLSTRRQTDWMAFETSRKTVKSALRPTGNDYYMSATLKNKLEQLWFFMEND